MPYISLLKKNLLITCTYLLRLILSNYFSITCTCIKRGSLLYSAF